MATIHKTIPFINGAYIDINDETNKNPKLYTGTNSALEQAEYSFESDGQIWVRTRTRASATDNWGAWGSWVHANNKINNDSIRIKETSLDQDVNPTDNYWGQGYYIYDKNGFEENPNRIACFRAHTRANQLGLQVEAKRMINGTAKYNTLNMYVDDSGNAVVELNREAWLPALGLTSATIATERVNGTIVKTPGKYAKLTAPTKSGYTFSHWVTAYTTGWVGSLYPDQPTSAASNFWLVALTESASTSKGSFGAVAVYYKN